jgi:hypothetical protein
LSVLSDAHVTRSIPAARVGQHLAIARIHDQRSAVEAGVAEAVFRGLLQVVVDRQLNAAAFVRLNLIEGADLAAHAVDDNALGAVLAHEQSVVGLLDALLADDVALLDAVADLPIARFANVAEQMRSQRVGRILPCRNFFDPDVGQLEVETAGGDRRDLCQRGILDDDDRPVARLAAVPIDGLLDLLGIEPGHLRQQPHRAIDVLGVLADDGNREGVAILDENLAVTVEHHPPRRSQGERALVIVLGHLLVFGVLNDLQHPEADPERGEHEDAPHLQGDQPCAYATSIFCDCHKKDPCRNRESGIGNQKL